MHLIVLFRLLPILLLMAVLPGCVYKRGYNPTFWSYSSTVCNYSSVKIDFMKVGVPNYDRNIALMHNLTKVRRSTSHDVNIPLRGVATAVWYIGDQWYTQQIDLNEFGLRSLKEGGLLFEFNDPYKLEVSLIK